MKTAQASAPTNGRYLLFLDILGFTRLVESRAGDEVYGVITGALAAFERWEVLNQQFRTLYFSDSFILYQEAEGYSDRAFLDVYALAGMILSALLAQGIAARGAISFGEFQVRDDPTGRRQVYFGKALVDAYQAEQREKWVGVSILPSAWRPYQAQLPNVVEAFESEKVWAKRDDGVLMLNPFIKLRSWYLADQIGEIDQPYMEWDAPEFPNDIRGFKFVCDMAEKYAASGDFSGSVAIKYHATVSFLRRVLGDDMFQWATRIAEMTNEDGAL